MVVGGHFMAFSGSSPKGKSFTILENEIMRRADTLQDAVELVQKANRSGSFGLMVADGKTGAAVALEATQSRLAERTMPADTLWMTNYAKTPEMKPFDLIAQYNLAMRDVAGRYQRISELVETHFGAITAEKMAAIMSDRQDAITGRERGAGPTVCGVTNVTSAVFSPREMLFWVATGPEPICGNPYAGFDFMAEFNGRSPDVKPAVLPGYQWQEKARKQGNEAYMAAFIAHEKDPLDIDTAIAHLKRAHAADPAECTYGRMLASLLIRAGEYGPAETVLNNCSDSMESNNETALTLALQGLIHDVQGRRTSAVSRYQGIVDMHARHGEDFLTGINNYLYTTARGALDKPLTTDDVGRFAAFDMLGNCQ